MPRGQRAAAPGNAYLTDQLIPYIGNKRKLLGLIGQAVEMTGLSGGTFLDLFAGSGVVGRFAKLSGFRVIANDWEPYARIINSAYISTNRTPPFECFGGAEAFCEHLNALPGVRGYIARHYCPADDEAPDTRTERMFFTQANGRRLDAIREELCSLREDGAISQCEHDLFVAALIFGTSWCSNTSGVFKGFHRGWGGATQTAWYRIREPLQIRVPRLYDNGQDNLTLQEDAALLAPRLDCDIAYLDPPYNQHQYGANYHLLNTVALWDKPGIPESISPQRGDKAAIRRDWREARRSAFCVRALAAGEMERLAGSLRARWILVSYSTDGLIPAEELVRALHRAGRLSWVHRPYKRYRVSSQRPSPRSHTIEFVLVVETAAAPDTRSRDRVLRALASAASAAPRPVSMKE